MGQAWEQTTEALFHFILFCFGMLYMPKLRGRAEWVGGNQTCKKLTLNKENTKLHVLCYTESFFRNKTESIAMKPVDNTSAKGFPHFLPSTEVLHSLSSFFFFFCQSARGKQRLLVPGDLHSLCPVNTALAWRAKLHLLQWPFLLSNLSLVELGGTVLSLSSEGGFRKE